MDNNEIIKKFKDKVKLVRLALLMAILGIVFIMGGTIYSYISGNLIIQIMGIILFIGSMLVNSISWRCPVCKKSLPNKQTIKHINYCSSYNAKLK